MYEKNDEAKTTHSNQRVITTDRKLRRSRAVPLALLLERYLQYLAMKGFTESTLRVRRAHMMMFLSWCKKSAVGKPTQLTKTILEDYQRHLYHYRKRDGQPLAVASQYSRLAPLKVWCKWLAKRNHTSQDPAIELELPRIGYKLPKVLNKDEAELVLGQPDVSEELGVRDRAILEILYSTGMRRMELITLKIYDVDQKNGLVSVREGKGKRDRVVPIGERALFWLDKYLKEVRPSIVSQPDDFVVFLTSAGKPFTPNHLSWLARRYGKTANIGKAGACHIFRHTMATLMLEGGADIRYIQAMLGHVRLDTTQIYTHVSIRMLKQIHSRTHPAARLNPRLSDVGTPPTQSNLQDTAQNGDVRSADQTGENN
jgi:integrase/recombinase XerD